MKSGAVISRDACRRRMCRWSRRKVLSADVCSVFEGFMDFLSAATLGLETGDCLVLNSVANVGKAVKHLDGYVRIDCFLDRDAPDGARWKRSKDTMENVSMTVPFSMTVART